MHASPKSKPETLRTLYPVAPYVYVWKSMRFLTVVEFDNYYNAYPLQKWISVAHVLHTSNNKCCMRAKESCVQDKCSIRAKFYTYLTHMPHTCTQHTCTLHASCIHDLAYERYAHVLHTHTPHTCTLHTSCIHDLANERYAHMLHTHTLHTCTLHASCIHDL